MRGNTNENWEIVSVFYSWEGHPILQIGPVCGNLETRALSSQFWSDCDFSGFVVLHDLPVSWLTVCGRLRSLSPVPKPNWLWYWWLALPASVYLLSYVALSANQRPVLSAGDQWGGVFAVLWLLLCPMVIMWPDTTISDDRRAGAADWAQQVSAGWTRGLSKQSQRLEPSDELMQARTRQLPPAGKCSLDNTQTWPGLLISHWHPQWHTRAARQNISAVPWYPTLANVSTPSKVVYLMTLPGVYVIFYS